MWKRRQKAASETGANAPVTPATEWQLPISEHSGTRTPSIYEFLVALLQSDGSYGKNPPELPDERRDPTSIGWSAGALDGIPIARESDVDNAETIADAISDLAAQSTEGRSRHLYSLVAHAEVLHVVDDVLQRIIDRRLDPRRVEAIGRWLATRSRDRSAVKVGIAMLGIAKSSETDVLLTLGAHDEFTLFVAVALRNSGASERVLFELAKRVHGWGRVQSVERLAGSTDPEIRRWMLVEGYQNGVMYEYLAMTCATTGGLALALTEESIDDQLLAGAGDIVAALIAGGPGPSIGAYEDAHKAVEGYLTHVSKRRGSLTQRRIVSTVRDALAEGDELAMDEVTKDRLLAVADEFLGRTHFRED
ncbi:MAG: hypothetical protein JWR83_943, partial [Aeromicrobium sp.]|nr:hypothetical protein [Aeromicrobium sp.]